MKKEKYISESKSNGNSIFKVLINYYDRDGSRRSKTKSFNSKDYASKREAMDAAIDYRDKTLSFIEKLDQYDDSVHTVHDVYEEKKVLFPLSEETHRKHDLLYKSYISQYGNEDIRNINSRKIQLSLNRAIDKSQEQLNRLYSLWKSIFKCAIVNDYVYVDQTLKVVIPKSEKIVEHRNVDMSCSIDDIANALRSYGVKEDTKYNGEVLALAMQLNYFLGLRPAELFALNKDDIDIKYKTISINKSVGTKRSSEDSMPISKRPEKVLKKTKTEYSVRVLPLPDESIDIVNKALEISHNELVFSRYGGDLIDSDFCTGFIKRACDKAGIEFRPYMLRHNLATKFITNNVDVRTVQELMGHANAEMTVGYARSNMELKRSVMNDIYDKD